MDTKKPNILIFSPTLEDPQSITLYEEIMDRGGFPVIIPLQDNDGEKKHAINISKSDLFFDLDLSTIRAVFVRCLNLEVPPSIPPMLDQSEFYYWKAKYIRENIKVNLFFSLLNRLERKDVLIINKPDTYFHHNTKGQLFHKLAEKGFPVPYTISTNDTNYFRKKSLNKKFIVKAAFGVGGTRRLKNPDLKNREELMYCPALFQEEIEGLTIRVHTVGEKVVLALKIFAEDIDSRTETKGFELCELDPTHEKIIIEANKLLGVHFSAWDVIIDKQKNIFLLDCNTGPYIWWISSTYARFVMKQLARYICAYVTTGDLKKANKMIITSNKFDFDKVYKFDEKLLALIDNTAKSWKTRLRLRN